MNEPRQTNAAVAGVCRRRGNSAGQLYQWEQPAQTGPLEVLQRKLPARGVSRAGEREADIDQLRVAVTELLTENLRPRKGGSL